MSKWCCQLDSVDPLVSDHSSVTSSTLTARQQQQQQQLLYVVLPCVTAMIVVVVVITAITISLLRPSTSTSRSDDPVPRLLGPTMTLDEIGASYKNCYRTLVLASRSSTFPCFDVDWIEDYCRTKIVVISSDCRRIPEPDRIWPSSIRMTRPLPRKRVD